jgi:hypothetical protein
VNIKLHRAFPDITTDRYVNLRVVELGRSLDARIPIYLDTNFWILLRKAHLGIGTATDSMGLLRRLRQAVADDGAFCPISDSTFCELLKQSDPVSRSATARLIDELSLGVTLLTHEFRLATELSHFFHSFHPDAPELHPLRHLVWSKLSYVLGFVHPTSTPFDADTERAVQKSFFDHMWTISLAAMVEKMASVPDRDELDLAGVAATLNDGNAQHAGAIRSFQQALEDELRGVADLCADEAVEILAAMAQEKGETPTPSGSADARHLRGMAANLIFHALRSRPATRRRLPTLYIEACLHAVFRWDKMRRFTGNDLYDFQHASAALGYCRAFFTEHPLRTLLVSAPLKLDAEFGCAIASSVPEAITALEMLQQIDSGPSKKAERLL